MGLPGVNHMKLPNWPEGIPSHWAQRLGKCPALTLGKAVLPKTPTVSDLPPAPWTESSPFAVHLQQMLFLGRKQYCANLWLRNENLGPDLKSSEPQCPHLSRRDHSSFPKSSGDQAQRRFASEPQTRMVGCRPWMPSRERMEATEGLSWAGAPGWM